MKISLNGVGKKFNGQWIFKNLSHEFLSGSQTAITGNNGSGKSTLLQIILGYQSHSKGTIQYSIDNILLEPEQLTARMAYAAPYLDLPEDFTLTEMLHFHFDLMPLMPGTDLNTVLEDTGLKGHENKAVKYFSSGMKQRLKLILALYADTPVLFLDEPCSNLDDQGIAWYRSRVQQLAKGRTLCIASNQTFEYDFCANLLRVTDFRP